MVLLRKNSKCHKFQSCYTLQHLLSVMLNYHNSSASVQCQ
uniref:Uncharacterized protein n=1 Tax=Arundo donax TaxID=35708 RepID=A0A0A9E5P4_ARUDO